MEEILLLVPNNKKLDIVKKVRKENYNKNIKFMSLEEFILKVTFTYTEEALYCLTKEYNLENSTASVYLDNLKYISDKLDNDKMNKLKDIKFFLNNHNLLIYNKKFVEYAKDKKIYIYGYNYINKYNLSILSKYNYEIIKDNKEIYKINNIYEFNTIEEEVLYVGNQISKLLKNKIDIKNIKLIFSDEYKYILPRIFKLYNIPLMVNKNSIYSVKEVKDALDDINKMDKIVSINNEEIRNKYIDILNKYNFVKDLNEVKDLIINDLKNTYINTDNGIKIYGINDYFSDEDYVFYLGFNKENVPTIYKDNDYFSDKEKEILSLDTSIMLNVKEKENAIANLLKIRNLFLSYKLSVGNNSYEISDLFDDINIIRDKCIDYKDSHTLNKILLTKKLDKLIKYNIKDKDLELLSNNYEIPYMKYDNNYHTISKDKLYKYLDNKLLLSYSAIENYNECKFKYYLSNILKINVIKDDFAIIVGNVCHYVLSKKDEDNFNPSLLFDEYLKEQRKFKDSELFFLSNIKEELLFIIDTIKKQLTYTTFNKASYEKKVYVDYAKNIKVTFMGVIDKLLYKEEDDITYLVVVDYKTGNTNIKLDNMEYGIGMQLPIYLYLSSNIGLNNIKVVGFYLQKLFNTASDNKKNYLEEKESNLKLEGYSLNNEKILSKFDTTYNNSKLIKSLKTTKEGFYKYSKVLTEKDINNLIENVNKIINKDIDNILNTDFSIDPKVINGNNVSCCYCEYKDICYLNEKNIKYIDKEVSNYDKMD